MADGGGLSAYLRARAADADGHATRAAGDYARALADAPANPLVAVRAFREALIAGDDALAFRALAVLDTAKVAPADGVLIPIAQAAAARDPAAYDAAVARLAGTPLATLTPALRQWSSRARTGAVPPLAAASDPVARRFATEAHALLLIAAGHAPEGVGAITRMTDPAAPIDVRIAAAQLLGNAGQADLSKPLQLDRMPENAAPTLAFGVSRLFVRVAADLAAAPTPSPLTITLARAALIADPSCNRAKLVLAAALDRVGATPHALALLDAVPQGGPFGPDAAAARIAILSTARPDEALASARVLALRTDAGAADWQRYADLLMTADRPAEAAPFYARITERDPSGWTGWLQFGAALDQAGRWRDAEPALVKAVALAPDEPLALNYLGYARIEHHEQLPAATAMLARAVMLKPDDASITDSLGWAYFRNGDVSRALPLLERAAAGQPGNAEIGEHLGDTYWTLGRRFEARYAWRAASLTATGAAGPRIAAKIADGLPAHR